MGEKTAESFAENVNKISTQSTWGDEAETISFADIDSRYKETDIGLSEQEFSALTRLHNAHINLDEEMQFIEQDQMKRQGYAFYSNLPTNVCEQSLNPKQLTERDL